MTTEIAKDDQGFTLTITGVGPWEKRASESEGMRMAIYATMAEARLSPDTRCSTCAFRTGTDANGSSLVVRCVDHTLQSRGSFMCHSVPEGEERECAGFAAIKEHFHDFIAPTMTCSSCGRTTSRSVDGVCSRCFNDRREGVTSS